MEELKPTAKSTGKAAGEAAGAGQISPQSNVVAVSIVAYRTDPAELAQLLDGLAATSHPVHVTVVDNSLTDELRSVADQRKVEYVHTGRNLGFGGGHNLALAPRLNESKYVLVVNPDISLDREVVGKLFAFMEHNPEAGLVMPRIENTDGSDQGLCKLLPTPADLMVRRFLGGVGKVLFRKQWERYDLKDKNLTRPCEVPCLSGCFMFLRADVLKKIGLFDERYFMYMEDVDLCRRIGAVARCVYYPLTAVTHGYAKGSYRNWSLLLRHAQSAVRYFSKWGWLVDAERKRQNGRAGTAVD